MGMRQWVINNENDVNNMMQQAIDLSVLAQHTERMDLMNRSKEDATPLLLLTKKQNSQRSSEESSRNTHDSGTERC